MNSTRLSSSCSFSSLVRGPGNFDDEDERRTGHPASPTLSVLCASVANNSAMHCCPVFRCIAWSEAFAHHRKTLCVAFPDVCRFPRPYSGGKTTRRDQADHKPHDKTPCAALRVSLNRGDTHAMKQAQFDIHPAFHGRILVDHSCENSYSSSCSSVVLVFLIISEDEDEHEGRQRPPSSLPASRLRARQQEILRR